jgi:Holliday junction DNA helicase RuvA
MIGYLKGTVVDIQKTNNNRVTITIEVNQIGYEVQIVPRLTAQLPGPGEVAQIFTHLQIKEEQMVIYGFGSIPEVSVSGIGPQLALALLDSLGMTELVQAIVSGNTRVLAKTPGVGTKTAERIALELKTKLSEWRQHQGLTTSVAAGLTTELQEEVEMTLLALGYTGSEIIQTLQALSSNSSLANKSNAEDWIREAIAWLSR